MKRPLFPMLLAAAGCLFGAYSYYYTDALTSINTTNWYQNGSLTATTGGLTAPTANGGTLVSKIAVPDGTSDYEVKSTLTLGSSGGTYVQLVRATTDAMSGPAPQGTYYAVELQNPTWSGGYCAATLAIYKRVSGTVTLLTSTSINCYSGMVLRTVARGTTIFVIHTSPYSGTIYGWPAAISITDSSIASGAAGVGAYNTPSGNAISQVKLGPLDRVVPSAVNAQSIATYNLPTRVEMQWQGVVDDANGIGFWDYKVYRNSVYIGQSFTPEYDDDAVAAGTTYTYTIYATDAHQNVSTSTSFTAVTPAAGSIDARRIGVRPLGSYWGGAGEQIDMLSGNLNFTYAVMTAMGRGGWSANFALNYNSQLWRQDSGGTWKLGRDIGYGFGWRLMAGSVTPIWTNSWQLDHFIYTDSTGAEYRLDQYDSPNCMWTSTEGVYVGYNPCANRLYFPDGSFWVMGATSGGVEQDAGVLYPTLMEDPNGNQVTIAYQNGVSSPTSNSSSRMNSIEDVRAVYTGSGPSGYQTYTFTYNTDAIPHLTNITSHITGVGNWTLTYTANQALNSPFSPSVAFGTTTLLSTAGRDADGMPAYQYQYGSNGSGELTQVTTMYSGALAWAYRSFTYTGSRTFREVQTRYLTIMSGDTQHIYPLTRNDATDAGLSIHSGVTLDDASGVGEKAWTFATAGSTWQLGLVTRFEDRPSAAQASQPIQRKDYTWVQNSGTTSPYIGTVLTTLDPTGANVQTKTTQTLDNHGNLLQTAIYDYGNLTTAARTYNYAYNYSFSGYGSTSYRLTSASVTNGSQSVTLATNTYDSTALANVTSIREHDANYGTGFTARGNLSATTPLGGPTTTINRDISGNMVSTNDGLGHTISVTTSTATNYVAPDVITPNSNTNLQQSMTYVQSLAVNSLTAPNNATASVSYDVWSRPASITSPYGAVTTYSYSNTAYGVLVQSTTNGRWEQHYLDGFGRTYTLNRGYGSTFVSVVNMGYGPCACSPIGKMTKVSEPFLGSSGPNYTSYTYDGMGRTLTVVASDGASTTTYAYSGNATTITDPAGKWKKQTVDIFGNIIQVNEPNPAGGADYVTTYTYDMLNHLSQVSMTRGTTTQTRTFNYGNPPGIHLLSETHPESGTTTYTYNTDNTLATKVDAKGQKTAYSYDTYQRVTTIQHYPNGTTEDMCQHVTISYDANSVDTTFTQNGWGRPTVSQWGATGCIGGDGFAYMYSYTAAGLKTKKRTRISRTLSGSLVSWDLDAVYTYDNEGQATSINYPNTTPLNNNGQPIPKAGPTYNYTFDSMHRPLTITDNQPTPVTWAKNVVYNAADQITAIDRVISTLGPQYSTETMQYNSLLQLTRQTLSTSGSSFDVQYNFSATQNNGRILSAHDYMTTEGVSYSYDTLNRLVGASSSGGYTNGAWAESYAYDGFGNLTDKTVTGGSAPPLHVTVNATNNRINGYVYDANGNLTSPPGLSSVSYDVENRMMGVALISGGGESYAYGPDNTRVYKKKTDGSEWLYVYGVFGERLGTYPFAKTPSGLYGVYYIGAPSDSRVYFAGRLLTTTLVDRVGSVRLQSFVDPNADSAYYPWGEEYESRLEEQEKFATYFRDGTTALDYARNRYYSSTLGRFVTADPYRNSAGPGDPGSWNRYVYANGDPVNHLDPGGLCWIDASWGPDLGPNTGATPCESANNAVWPRSDSPLPQGGPGGPGDIMVRNYTTTSKEAIGVQNSLRTLEAALSKDQDCNRWLKNSALVVNQLLGNVPGVDLRVGVGNFSDPSVNAVTGSIGTNLPPATAGITVNVNGAFFRSSASTGIDGVNGTIAGGTDAAKAFILLHELAHATGAAGFQEGDRGPIEQNFNNGLVLQHCEKALKLFGAPSTLWP